MKNSQLIKLIQLLCIGVFAAAHVLGQDGTQERSVISTDFPAKRPVKTRVGETAKKPNYYAVRSYKNLAKPKRTGKAAVTPKEAVKAKTVLTEIGVTMWKLRPPTPDETGYLLPVVDANGKRQMWLSERVAAEKVFSSGDKVRFGVESSMNGYLYVIDRETHSDGTFGDPFLIFPESLRDNNTVGPGILVDIPDQMQDVPYFNMTPQDKLYTGEFITIIISPTPLTDLTVGLKGNITNTSLLSDIENEANVELISRDDTVDKIYSKTEAESACGPKTRQQAQGQTKTQPCGTKTRQLTRDEPLPQSIYRVKNLEGKPAVAFVSMAVH